MCFFKTKKSKEEIDLEIINEYNELLRHFENEKLKINFVK